MDEPIREPVDSEVRAALMKGNKIEAIKIYREAAGCGLKEAKEAVERYVARVEREQPGLLPKATGCGIVTWFLCVMILVAACGWLGG